MDSLILRAFAVGMAAFLIQRHKLEPSEDQDPAPAPLPGKKIREREFKPSEDTLAYGNEGALRYRTAGQRAGLGKIASEE